MELLHILFAVIYNSRFRFHKASVRDSYMLLEFCLPYVGIKFNSWFQGLSCFNVLVSKRRYIPPYYNMGHACYLYMHILVST